MDRNMGNKLGWRAAATVLLLGALPAASHAEIKCWTNSEGVRECGNVVPPEYAQEGHEELSEEGIVVDTQERAKTAEELAAEREAKEQQTQREIDARVQAERDRVLLDTFTTEEDLLLARDGKLKAIDTRIEHTQQVTDKLKEKLAELEEAAADGERAGKKVSDELQNEIAGLEQQISEQMSFIEERNKEKEDLRAQFDLDLARYRELKTD
jgi:hypothetical protein